MVGLRNDGSDTTVIYLFSDFGLDGPYVGEMRAAAMREARNVAVCDLMHDAPTFDAKHSSYLLAALLKRLLVGDVLVAVVDPGVGTERTPIAMEVDGRWLVGPDNGLFEIARRHARAYRCKHIVWRPENMSASFHGRDLFAPVAGRLARGDFSPLVDGALSNFGDWPVDLAEIIYVDGFGNLMTGLRRETVEGDDRFEINGREIRYCETFARTTKGEPFWYINSAGLVEIAANQASAATLLEIGIGSRIARRSS